MKSYIAIYGGTELSEAIASFVEDLSFALLKANNVVLVTGGFHYSKKDPKAVSTDISVLKGARKFGKEKKIALAEFFETWLPDAEKDRNKEGVVRFQEGNVRELAGESAQARRFRMVRDVNVLITIKGKKNTAMTLDFALSINKPALPLSFTGGDSRDYWNANRDRIKKWFGIDDTFANELQIDNIETLPVSERENLIEKILVAVDKGLHSEVINDTKYKHAQKEWEINNNQTNTEIIQTEKGNPFEPDENKERKSNTGIIEMRQVKCFLSYSHKDEILKKQLDNHLTALKRSDKISVWNDEKIEGGSNWDTTIKEQLGRADIILLLLSSDFMASQYIWDTELKLAIERHKQGKAKVIPIFLRRCDFQDMPFEKLQGYPKDAKPVTSFPEREQDEVFYQIVKGIRADLQN